MGLPWLAYVLKLVTAANIVIFIVSVTAGAVIYTAIKLFFAATAFWFKESVPFLQAAYDTADFAKYPIEIYPKPIQFVITFILPFAFVAYIPAKFFLVKTSVLETVGVECILAIIFWSIAYWLFKKGISIYESAGN